MISCSNLGKSFGKQTLFAGASFQLNPGNRYGLVGANGSGKSTFLKMLAGEEEPSEGILNMPKRLRLGVLEQDHFQFEENRIVDVVMMGHRELWKAIDEKEKLLANADVEFDGERYAELEDIVVRYDGYTLEARAGEILEGLGIPTEQHPLPLSTLSGGFT
ncbi:MAG: ATP-binding cassette domain-containing protein, partial [Acidobacteriota bacterium]